MMLDPTNLRFRTVLNTMSQLDLGIQPQNDTRRSLVRSHPPYLEDNHLPDDLGDALRGLWADPGVQAVISRPELHLDEDAAYYLGAIGRVRGPKYLPSDQDIVQCQKSTGVAEMILRAGALTYRLFDVRGNGSMRKWLPCFENVTALLFVVSIDQYDEALPDESDIASISLLPRTRLAG
jgi:guanine nucleotide-binding protein G(i) subunit alpha